MKEHLQQATVTAAICVLAIAAYTTLKDGTRAQAAPAASPRTPSTLHVTGAGTVDVRPDHAVITFSVRGRGGSLSDAERVADAKMSRLLAAMSTKGVLRRDMQTQGQNASRVGSGGRFVAYQTLQVTVRHVLEAGKLVSAGVATGAARDSQGPVYTLESKQRAEDAALAAAVRQARSRADAVAAAAGLHITGVVTIQETTEQPPYYPGPVYGAADGVAASTQALAPMPTRPGRQEVSANVTVVYAYAPS
jgi:uncharacterized protein YggE